VIHHTRCKPGVNQELIRCKSATAGISGVHWISEISEKLCACRPSGGPASSSRAPSSSYGRNPATAPPPRPPLPPADPLTLGQCTRLGTVRGQTIRTNHTNRSIDERRRILVLTLPSQGSGWCKIQGRFPKIKMPSSKITSQHPQIDVAERGRSFCAGTGPISVPNSMNIRSDSRLMGQKMQLRLASPPWYQNQLAYLGFIRIFFLSVGQHPR
jgi:hypothetical protein